MKINPFEPQSEARLGLAIDRRYLPDNVYGLFREWNAIDDTAKEAFIVRLSGELQEYPSTLRVSMATWFCERTASCASESLAPLLILKRTDVENYKKILAITAAILPDGVHFGA